MATTKKELIEIAKEFGLEVNERMTVDQIEELIRKHGESLKDSEVLEVKEDATLEEIEKALEEKKEVTDKKKVRCIIQCTGYGYEDFKVNTARELPTKLADLLIGFGYVEEIK